MPDNIYPDLSNAGFDIKYHELKVLQSDVRRGSLPGGRIITGNDTPTDTGGGSTGDPPGGGVGCKKVYRANLTGGPDPANPIATIFENGIGPITWERIEPGFYQGTSAGLFPVGGTWWMCNNPFLEAMSNPSTDTYVEVRLSVIDDSTAILIVRDVGLNTNIDNFLNNVSIEITTYCATGTETGCNAFVPFTLTLPIGGVGVDYLFETTMVGDPTFIITPIDVPSWMTITPIGNTLRFEGTPDVSGTDIPVQFTVQNCDNDPVEIDLSINVFVMGAFTVTETVMAREEDFSVQIGAPNFGASSAHGYVDWGDGSLEEFTIASFATYTPLHTYSDSTTPHTIVFYFDTNATLTGWYTNWAGGTTTEKITFWTHSTNFTNLGLFGVGISGVDDIANCFPPSVSHIGGIEYSSTARSGGSSMTSIDLSGLPTLTTRIGITNFQNLTTITNIPSHITAGFDFYSPAALTSVPGTLPAAAQQQIQGAPGLTIGTLNLSVCNNFNMQNDYFSVSDINAFLVALDANGFTGGNCNIGGQTPAAAPTGAGATAKANLITKGWSVGTD